MVGYYPQTKLIVYAAEGISLTHDTILVVLLANALYVWRKNTLEEWKWN